MYARPTLTPEAIEAAAERLASKGEKVSVRTVRAEAGGGSPNLIAPVVAAWKAKRPKIEASLSVSAELQRAILGEVTLAVAAARAELTDELADLKETLATTAEELEHQAALTTAAEERAATATGEAKRQAGTIDELKRELSEAREQIVREQEAAKDARREAAEAAVRLEMVPGLQAEIANLRAELKAEREARLRAEIAAAELRGPRAQPPSDAETGATPLFPSAAPTEEEPSSARRRKPN